MEDSVIQQAFEVWEELSRDDKKWWEYESRFKAMADSWDQEYCQKNREKIALEEGDQQGLHQAKLEVALKLLAHGMTVDEVVELSGLPKIRVEKINKQK